MEGNILEKLTGSLIWGRRGLWGRGWKCEALVYFNLRAFPFFVMINPLLIISKGIFGQ